MLPKYHIAYGIAFSVLLYFILPEIGLIGTILVLASSILIDTDHFIYYAVKNKSWNLKKAIKYFKDARKKRSKIPEKQRKKYYGGWCFIHGIETLIILFLLGTFFSIYFFYILIGVAFHLTLDLIEQIQGGSRIDKISLVYDYFKFKKLKKIKS